MSDDNDDPVMALLATQRAVLAAVENLAGQVEAMQRTLAQLVAGSAIAPVAQGSADRPMTIGDRFRAATPEEAERDPELRAAQSQLVAMVEAAREKFADKPDMLALVREKGREQLATFLDEGKVITPAASSGRDRER